MISSFNSKYLSLALGACLLLSAGCYDSSLPAELPVPLPDGSTVVAPANTGASRLANTSWTVYADPNNPLLLLSLDFGPDGQVVRMFDNNVYPDFLGSELMPDGQVHSTPWQGGSYVGQFYGTGSDPYVGYAARARGFLGPLAIATGNFLFSGTLVDNHIDGTLDFSLEIDPSIASLLPFSPGAFHADVIALPVGVALPSPAADAFEPDNDAAGAKPIQIGERQSHSIFPEADEDWFSFSIAEQTSVVIETSGQRGDTVLILFDSNLNPLQWDDDGGVGQFSRLNMMDLPAGIYYIRVNSYDGSMISHYNIQVSQFQAPSSQPTV